MRYFIFWLENSIRKGDTVESSFDYILGKEIDESGNILDTVMTNANEIVIKDGKFNRQVASKNWKNSLFDIKKDFRIKEGIGIVFITIDQQRKFIDMNNRFGRILDVKDAIAFDMSSYYDNSINYDNSSAEILYKVTKAIKEHGIQEIKNSVHNYKKRNHQGEIIPNQASKRIYTLKGDKLIANQIYAVCKRLGFIGEISGDLLMLKTMTGDYIIDIFRRPCQINQVIDDKYQKILTDFYSPIDAIIKIKNLEEDKLSSLETKYADRRIIDESTNLI